ncbi:MAG TPA: PadR family transcriptional regulator [Acidimicrobiales bacterium]
MERRPTLSLNEWAVLGLLVDAPRHGYDIAAALQPGTRLGDVWRLSRQLVYRALQRLDDLGLVRPVATEPGAGGPPRTTYEPTPAGRAALDAWLVTPVEHLREVRNALLLKLLLAERLGRATGPLVRAQRQAFAPLLDRLTGPPPPADPVAAWRHHSARAVAGFLDTLDILDAHDPPGDP